MSGKTAKQLSGSCRDDMFFERPKCVVAAVLLCLTFGLYPTVVQADDFDDAFNEDITKDVLKGDSEVSTVKPLNKPETKKVESAQKNLARTSRKLEYEMQNQQADFQLYLQMQKVDNWLSQYCVWNHHWPEYIDEQNGCINQLAELVPNNPYLPGQLQESEGSSTDPDYRYYNQPLNQFYNGEAASGFDPQSFQPNNSYEAYGRKKIRLLFDPSITAEQVREWEYDPPESWNEPPGTITGISNGQNLIVVWGAGADGRPIKVPGSKKRIRMFISNIWMQGNPSNY